MLNKLYQKYFGKRVLRYKEFNLPYFRNNHSLEDNQEYIDSASDQIIHLNNLCSLNQNTHFLDFGCGQGRIANGFEYTKINIGSYTGIDTNPNSIKWCKSYIESIHPKYTFTHVPSYNARYNKKVKGLKPLPFPKDKFNVIFLNSVFSHMLTEDVNFYLREFYRVLQQGGIVYMTAFVEEYVLDVEENPTNFVRKSVGALHHVRFEKNYFFNLVKNAGFKVKSFHYRHFERSNQSIIVAEKEW